MDYCCYPTTASTTSTTTTITWIRPQRRQRRVARPRSSASHRGRRHHPGNHALALVLAALNCCLLLVVVAGLAAAPAGASRHPLRHSRFRVSAVKAAGGGGGAAAKQAPSKADQLAAWWTSIADHVLKCGTNDENATSGCHKEGALTEHFGARAAVSPTKMPYPVKDVKIYWIYNNAKRTGPYKEKSVFGTSWSDAQIKDACMIARGQNGEGLAHSKVAKYSNTCIETTRDSCYPFVHAC
ncbi:hypothetical protein DFJ73DRAFT_780758 [Zopfochytrium polystomum]|nr:hypothetical protein DFJ73DRAFT_780758 [Zopfochytrium polystomum]